MDITPYLYIPFITWVTAQAIKFFLALIRGDVDLRYLYASGGMPSVHSAVVTSLATWALIAGGLSNPLFGITAVFAAIVMYDSFGVRRSSGEQARTINNLIADLARTGGIKNAEDYRELREILGHKPLEVVVGSILGFVIACFFGYQRIGHYFDIFNYQLDSTQSKSILFAMIAIVIIAVVLYLLIRRRFAKNVVARKYNLYLLVTNLGISFLAACLAFLYYERIYYTYGLLGFVGIGLLWLAGIIYCVYNMQKAAKAKQTSEDKLRKDAWLKRAGKKK